MNDCESCIHYPPSASGGKPCCFCETTDPLLNCYQRKDDIAKYEGGTEK